MERPLPATRDLSLVEDGSSVLFQMSIGISGRFGDHIDSIRFYTNKKTSQVFGGSGGTVDFGYTAPQGQMIVSFFGRAGDNLDAIGVLYAPCTPDKKPCR